MHPVLHLGGFTVYTYGLLLAAAVLVGVGMGALRGRRAGFSFDHISNIALIGVIAGLFGGRLLGFVLAYDPGRAFFPQFAQAVRSTGAVQGGLIAAVVLCVWYMRRNHLPVWAAADAAAPAIALAQAIGRVGCFMAGCCYGIPADVPWAVTFMDPISTTLAGTPLGQPLHPTQLYEAAATLVIGVGLLATEKRGQYFLGRTFWLYALLYGVVRFVIEFYRPSAASGISPGQMISIGVCALSVVMLLVLGRRSRARIGIPSTRRAAPATPRGSRPELS